MQDVHVNELILDWLSIIQKAVWADTPFNFIMKGQGDKMLQ